VKEIDLEITSLPQTAGIFAIGDNIYMQILLLSTEFATQIGIEERSKSI